MAMTAGQVSASCQVRVAGTFPPQGVASELRNHTIKQTVPISITTLPFGTSSGQVDLISCSYRTINATTAATYDLYTGTDLPDIDGNTAAFRTISFVQIGIESGGDATGVEIGDAASQQWVGFFGASGDTHKIFPGGPAYQAGSPAGVAVGATTNNLKVENLGAAAVTVSIVIGGRST